MESRTFVFLNIMNEVNEKLSIIWQLLHFQMTKFIWNKHFLCCLGPIEVINQFDTLYCSPINIYFLWAGQGYIESFNLSLPAAFEMIGIEYHAKLLLSILCYHDIPQYEFKQNQNLRILHYIERGNVKIISF